MSIDDWLGHMDTDEILEAGDRGDLETRKLDGGKTNAGHAFGLSLSQEESGEGHASGQLYLSHTMSVSPWAYKGFRKGCAHGKLAASCLPT